MTDYMWSDAELKALIESCKRSVSAGHRTVMMPPDRLAMALTELLAFRQIESDLLATKARQKAEAEL